MLDGIIIVENNLKRIPLTQGLDHFKILKKRYLSIVVSLLVHVVFALSLLFISNKQTVVQNIKTDKAIKSFLYKLPEKLRVKKSEIAPVKQQEPLQEIKPIVKENFSNKLVNKVIEETINKEIETSQTSNLASAPSNTKVEHAPKASKVIKRNYSTIHQLDNLRDAINKQIVEQSVSQRQQFKSASLMHGEQTPVPHSKKQLTPEQIRESKTTKMSDDISITKYDNGLCTIERKKFIGSPVEGSTSAFSCGESKFDQSFRKHMEKVRDKLFIKR